jgi:hypothetical protein
MSQADPDNNYHLLWHLVEQYDQPQADPVTERAKEQLEDARICHFQKELEVIKESQRRRSQTEKQIEDDLKLAKLVLKMKGTLSNRPDRSLKLILGPEKIELLQASLSSTKLARDNFKMKIEEQSNTIRQFNQARFLKTSADMSETKSALAEMLGNEENVRQLSVQLEATKQEAAQLTLQKSHWKGENCRLSEQLRGEAARFSTDRDKWAKSEASLIARAEAAETKKSELENECIRFCTDRNEWAKAKASLIARAEAAETEKSKRENEAIRFSTDRDEWAKAEASLIARAETAETQKGRLEDESARFSTDRNEWTKAKASLIARAETAETQKGRLEDEAARFSTDRNEWAKAEASLIARAETAETQKGRLEDEAVRFSTDRDEWAKAEASWIARAETAETQNGRLEDEAARFSTDRDEWAKAEASWIARAETAETQNGRLEDEAARFSTDRDEWAKAKASLTARAEAAETQKGKLEEEAVRFSKDRNEWAKAEASLIARAETAETQKGRLEDEAFRFSTDRNEWEKARARLRTRAETAETQTGKLENEAIRFSTDRDEWAKAEARLRTRAETAETQKGKLENEAIRFSTDRDEWVETKARLRTRAETAETQKVKLENEAIRFSTDRDEWAKAEASLIARAEAAETEKRRLKEDATQFLLDRNGWAVNQANLTTRAEIAENKLSIAERIYEEGVSRWNSSKTTYEVELQHRDTLQSQAACHIALLSSQNFTFLRAISSIRHDPTRKAITSLWRKARDDVSGQKSHHIKTVELFRRKHRQLYKHSRAIKSILRNSVVDREALRMDIREAGNSIEVLTVDLRRAQRDRDRFKSQNSLISQWLVEFGRLIQASHGALLGFSADYVKLMREFKRTEDEQKPSQGMEAKESDNMASLQQNDPEDFADLVEFAGAIIEGFYEAFHIDSPTEPQTYIWHVNAMAAIGKAYRDNLSAYQSINQLIHTRLQARDQDNSNLNFTVGRLKQDLATAEKAATQLLQRYKDDKEALIQTIHGHKSYIKTLEDHIRTLIRNFESLARDITKDTMETIDNGVNPGTA